MKITSNNRQRPLIAWLDIPESLRMGELNGYVDMFDDESDAYELRFVKGYGTYWDTRSDFQRLVRGESIGAPIGATFRVSDWDGPLSDWDGIATIGSFAGCVIKLPHGNQYDELEDDHVILGWASSLS